MTEEQMQKEIVHWKAEAERAFAQAFDVCGKYNALVTRYNEQSAMNAQLRKRADGKIEEELRAQINGLAHHVEGLELYNAQARALTAAYRAQIQQLGYVPVALPTAAEVLERNDAKVEGREPVAAQRQIEVGNG